MNINHQFLAAKAGNLLSYFAAYQQGLEITDSLPVEIFIETANACNLNCVMCLTHNGNWGENTPVIPYNLIEKIQTVFSSALQVRLHGFGEPLVNKHLLEIIHLIRCGGPVWIDFFTNGILLTSEKSEKIVQESVDRVTFSIDGASPETYEYIHDRAKLPVLLRNLEALNKLRKEKSTSQPRLDINFIAMNSNFTELPDLVDLAAKYGISHIEVKPLITYAHMPELEKEKRVYTPEIDDPIITEVKERSARTGVSVYLDLYTATGKNRSDTVQNAPRDPAPLLSPLQELQQKRCFQPWKTVYIKASGDVLPCCFFDKEYALGNLHTASLEEIWNGEKTRVLRSDIAAGHVHKGCEKCFRFEHRPFTEDVSSIFNRKASEEKFDGRFTPDGVYDGPEETSIEEMLIPEEAVELINLTNKSVEAGDLRSAQQYLSQALAISPHHPWLLVTLGNLKMANQEGDAPICFEQAIRSDPHFTQAYAALANWQVTNAQVEQARLTLLRCLQANPTDPDAIALIARL